MSSLKQNYVIALDFGYPMNPQQKSSITDLASFIMRNYADEPQTVVLAQNFIYDSLCRMKFPKDRLLEVSSGQSSTAGLSSGGSYQMLQMAAGMLRQLEICGTRPLLDDLRPGQAWPPLSATVVAHALHVRRVVRQGKLLGLQLAPPPRSCQRHFTTTRRNGGAEADRHGTCAKRWGSFPCGWRAKSDGASTPGGRPLGGHFLCYMRRAFEGQG